MPQTLRDADKANFETLLQAARDGNLAIMSAVRKSDRKDVVLVCAMGRDGDDVCPTPLAVMVEGDPFEDFEDPTVVT